MATLGDTTIEANTDTPNAGDLVVWGPTTAAQSGTLTAGWVYASNTAGGTRNLQVVIYTDNGSNYPGTLVDFTSALVPGASAGWINGAATNGASITSGNKYWIGYWAPNTNSGANQTFYATGTGTGRFLTGQTSITTPFTGGGGGPNAAQSYSNYWVFTPSGGGTIVTTETLGRGKRTRPRVGQPTYIVPAVVNIPTAQFPPSIVEVKPRQLAALKQKEPLRIAPAPVQAAGPAPQVTRIAQVKPRKLAPVHKVRLVLTQPPAILAAGAAPVVTRIALVRPRLLGPVQQLHKGQRLSAPVVTAATSQVQLGLPIVGVGS